MNVPAIRLPLRVAVLLGGNSAEREVSLESGANVASALRDLGHQIILLDPAREPLESLRGQVDVILPMLHGTGYEDGELQQTLEGLQLPWLGSSAIASSLTFDKVATRERLTSQGLPVPPGLTVQKDDLTDGSVVTDGSVKFILRQVAALTYPVVVKPAAQGSSVGVSIVQEPHQLQQALEDALKWGDTVLVEKYIAGRELTVPVIDGVAFPAVEILPARPWYDYSAKYSDEATQYIVNPLNTPREMASLVMEACRACEVSGITRTDLRVDSNGRCWILEINTIPGMTSHSLVPMSAASLGVSIGELCEKLLRRLVASSQQC